MTAPARIVERRYGGPLTEPFTVPNLWSELPKRPITSCSRTNLIITRSKSGPKDGMIDRLLYAGNISTRLVSCSHKKSNWPRIRLTIRQRTRVLAQWPQDE